MIAADDLEDTHLCIKCNATIVGLDKYVQHRKQGCSNANAANLGNQETSDNAKTSAIGTESSSTAHEISTTIITTTNETNLNHNYESFAFTEPEVPSSYVNKSEHGGKSTKSLTDAYDLTYELGADLFFSSLQLQSVTSSGPSTSGKIGSSAHIPLQRQKSQTGTNEEHTVHESWIGTAIAGTDKLIKAVNDISDAKKHDFKPLQFVQESPDASSEEEDEEEAAFGDDDDDDEDYDPIADAHAMGVKWKLSPMRHSPVRQSPPTVPISHTGGKWKPENRPQLQVTHMERISPSWDEHADDLDIPEAEQQPAQQHPPEEHTKGKWVPGSKVQRLEYREGVNLTRLARKQSFWCNICCRKLKSKVIYEQHLRTSYHMKRAEPEQQLEQATLDTISNGKLTFNIEASPEKDRPIPAEILAKDDKEPQPAIEPDQPLPMKKRKRRSIYVKCELCKHVVQRHLIGKHLISHYHYRRMRQQSSSSNARQLQMILENMHSIVLQAPYQCRSCRYYANTEEAFLQHWLSETHLSVTKETGTFYCSYCQYECGTNDQMYGHLLGAEHKEVILAVNRSVPIYISKRISINCSLCGQSFRYNAELRQHFATLHSPGTVATDTASDAYQWRFECSFCGEALRSKIALQRHEKFKHRAPKYFCNICKLEFSTALKARQHRKSSVHKRKAAAKTGPIENYKSREHQISRKGKLEMQTEIAPVAAPKESEPPIKIFEENRKENEKPECATEQKLSPAEPPPKKSRRTTIKCQTCQQKFNTNDELKLHRLTTHNLESHECMLCNESFQTAQALGRHTRSCQPKSSTSSSMDILQQSSIAVDKAIWKCNECNFRASYESDLIYHRFLHTHGSVGKNELLKCPFCPKSFRKHSLRCHLRQHTNEKIFECDKCQMKFARRSNLKNHIATIHTEEHANREKKTKPPPKPRVKKVPEAPVEYVCDVCGKILATKYTLKMHTMNHTQAERKYPCTYEGCQYSGLTKHILNTHLASHSKDNFKCEHENCDYVGKSAIHLKRHLQSHAARSKIYSCDQCDFKAHIKSHIRRHMPRHTGEKPNQCPYCDFRCSNFDNLRKHILKTYIHPGKFIYECKICAQMKVTEIFKSNQYSEYQNHLISMHEKT